MFQSIFIIWTKILIFEKISWLNREKIFLLTRIMYQDNGFNFFEICPSYHTCSIWSDFLLPKCIYFRFEENISQLVVTRSFHSLIKRKGSFTKRSLICRQVFSLIEMLPGEKIYVRKMWNFVDCVFYNTVYTFVKYTGGIEAKISLIIIIHQDDDFSFIEIGSIYDK